MFVNLNPDMNVKCGKPTTEQSFPYQLTDKLLLNFYMFLCFVFGFYFNYLKNIATKVFSRITTICSSIYRSATILITLKNRFEYLNCMYTSSIERLPLQCLKSEII